MCDLIDLIESRRSVKKYKSDPVPQELIQKVVEAGTYAPTGMNRQSPVIVAVTDKAVRDRLAAANAEIGGFGAGVDPFYNAPAVLIVLADASVGTAVYDGSLVMQNLMLAAHALGLGSCWIHRAREEFEMPEWKNWLKSIGVEGDYIGIGHCILGYTQGDYPQARPRKDKWVYYVK